MVFKLDWKTQQKMREDAKQFILNPDLSITENKSLSIIEKGDKKFNDVVLCPFCLNSNELGNFYFRKGFRVCPNCSANLKLSTLSEITNLDKFVKFVFNYRFNGFWSKICLDVKPITSETRFKTWNNRLYLLGLSFDFWEKYKNLRGDLEDE